jgi:predicted amidohydrolase
MKPSGRHLPNPSRTHRQPVGEGEPEPTHIVWAETAVPFILTEAPDALAAIAEALQPGQTLATGAIRIERGAGSDQSLRYYNSITVIDDRGEITAAADKVHLVPFGGVSAVRGDVAASSAFRPSRQEPQAFRRPANGVAWPLATVSRYCL